MLPIDPDDALLRALRLARDGGAGDPGSADEQMASRIGAIASGGAPAEPLVEPPAALWDAIARELQLPGATGPVAVSPPAAGPAAEVDAVVVPLAPRRRPMGRRWLLPVVAAAAVAIVVGVFALSGGSQPDVVAEVALQPLEGDGSGEAKVLALDDGASWELPPAAGADTVRTIYVFEGRGLAIGGHVVDGDTGALVRCDRPVTLTVAR